MENTNKLKQKAGDNSNNFQANEITIINNGPSPSEMEAIALEVYKKNIVQMTSEANQTMDQRAHEISEKIIEKLRERYPESTEEFRKPSILNSLYTVQREYAIKLIGTVSTHYTKFTFKNL